MVKIFLDAGHGKTDSGAVGNGLLEKNLTLDIAKRIEAKLKAYYQNVEVMQTRTTDTFLTLEERTDKANRWKADIFLSIHINASTNVSAKGFETHIYTNADAKTKAFQNVMQAEILKAISEYSVTNRGKKFSNFHVLRESQMTAILTETLFLSNSADAKLLKDNTFIEKVASGHVIGLERFLGLEKALPPPIVDETLFQVVAGTFSNRDSAELLLKKLKADGYDGYINRK